MGDKVCRRDDKVLYRNQEITFDDQAMSDSKDTRLAFCSNLKKKIETRFPSDSCNIVNAFDVMGLRPLTFLSDQDVEEYGKVQMHTLAEHFGTPKKCQNGEVEALVNAEESKHEWQLLKRVAIQQRYPRQSTAEFWKIVQDFHADTFPNLLQLARIALVLPLQTADVERAFSCQNLIKNSQRNRLSPEMVNKLMVVDLEGPDIKDFNFDKAAAHWKSVKQRNIFK
jgi:hypothetical protein